VQRLRVTLFGRSSGTVGRYSRTGTGESTGIWGHAQATLDRHAQGIDTDFLLFQPLGDRPATLDVRTTARRLTSLHLLRGHVLVRSRRSRLAFLHAGDRVTVRCNNAGDCSVDRGA
jgi:hypothetical protein